MIHKDIATLSNLVADDWTIQNDSGSMGTKAGFINDVKSGKLVVISFRLHDVHVHVHGNVAFVQGFAPKKVTTNAGNTTMVYSRMHARMAQNRLTEHS